MIHLFKKLIGYFWIIVAGIFLTACPPDPEPKPTTGTYTFWIRSDLGVGNIQVSLDNSNVGTISHYDVDGVTCGKGDVNVEKPAGVYSYVATGDNGTKWTGTATFENGECFRKELILSGNGSGSGSGTGQAVFWTSQSNGWSSIDVTVGGTAVGTITGYYTSAPGCGSNLTVTRAPGTYAYTAKSNTGVTWSGNITISANQCGAQRLDFPSTSTGNCDWNSATKCVTVTKAVKGTRCGKSNSVDIEWKNSCNSNIKVVVCIQRLDGTWACSPDGTFDTGMKPNQILSNYVCEGTGKYRIYAMPIADYLKTRCAYPE